MLPARVKTILIGGIIGLAALVTTVHVTDVCRLEAVTFNGQPVDDFEAQLGLRAGALVSNQPLESVADSLLHTAEVKKIDIAVRLPDQLAISTNQFAVTALILSENTGKMYGLDAHGRVVPLPREEVNWECPLLVNAGITDLYEPCRDVRVPMILRQLDQLADDEEDLYRLIAEIDLQAADHIEILITGLPYKLWATSSRLADQLGAYVAFVQHYRPDLTDATRIDLRFEDMIICGAGK